MILQIIPAVAIWQLALSVTTRGHAKCQTTVLPSKIRGKEAGPRTNTGENLIRQGFQPVPAPVTARQTTLVAS